MGTLVVALLGCRETTTNPTFNEHIATIVHARCAPCHRPGEAAPFSLIEYEDVADHAEQIVEVTQSGYMPPWLPEKGVNEFRGDRSLSEDELALIARWAERGAPEGPALKKPTPPEFPEGWQLGPPDLVLEMSEPWTVPADGPDVFRSFVFSTDTLEAPRHVRAVAFRPGNAIVVHHANIFVDSTRSTRHLDLQDPGPGFEGMNIGGATSPQGQFLAWTPGKRSMGSEQTSWTLHPGMDVLSQLHLQPSGRPEPVQTKIGLYFTDKPPGDNYVMLTLASRAIDIPAGEPAYPLDMEYELPVDAEILAVYPHAHFLGEKIHAVAVAPDGEEKWIIKIDDWDFNWQDEYYYVEPLALEKGTTIKVHYEYNNSTDNPQNQNDPPIRVFAGEESKDEMANFYLQVRVKDRATKAALLRDFDAEFGRKTKAELEMLIERVHNPVLGLDLGRIYESEGRMADAISVYRRVIQWKPDFALAYNNLGVALLRSGKPAAGKEAIEAALAKLPRYDGKLGPGAAELYNNLGNAEKASGNPEAALARYNQALGIWPDYPDSLYNAGVTLAEKGDIDSAIAHYQRAIAVRPTFHQVHTNLGIAYARKKQLDVAGQHFQRAADLAPSPQTFFNLAFTLDQRGDKAGATKYYARVLKLQPGHPGARKRLERLRRAPK